MTVGIFYYNNIFFLSVLFVLVVVVMYCFVLLGLRDCSLMQFIRFLKRPLIDSANEGQ